MNIDLGALGELEFTWWDVLWATISIAAGWIASVFAYRGVLAVMRRTPNVSDGLALFVARFTRYALIIFGVAVGIGFFGPSLQPLIAIVVIIAVIGVLVLRGIADNFAAGVLIQTRNPIRVGDEIEHEHLVGTVRELNGRSVIMLTRDGRTVHIPNAKAISDVVVNHSAHGARRAELEVRVSGEGLDLAEVATSITDAAAAVDGVHRRESVRPLFVAVADDRVVLRLQFWHHPLHGPETTSAAVEAVHLAASTNGWQATVTSLDVAAPLTRPDPV